MKEINNIWHFFENMNEYVYVTDIETYEMIYESQDIGSLWVKIPG